jgi:hypothetical protein
MILYGEASKNYEVIIIQICDAFRTLFSQVQICILNLSDIASEFNTLSMFQIFKTYEPILYRICRYVYDLSTEFSISSSFGSLVIAMELKVKYIFYATGI